MDKKNRKLLIFLLIALLLFLLDHFFSLRRYLSLESLKGLQQLAKEHLFLACLIYILAMSAGSVLLALPGLSFAIAAGLLFGPVLGTMLCAFSASIGAVLSFLLGRYFLKDKIKPLAMKNLWLRKYLFEDVEKNDFLLLMITRLVPLFPFNLQNFAYGVTDMKLSVYAVGTFLFILPGTAVYTTGAAGLASEEHRVKYLLIAGGLLLFSLLLSFLFKKYFMRSSVQKEEERGET